MGKWQAFSIHGVAALLCAMPLLVNADYQIVGKAYDLKTGALQYSEYHKCANQGLDCLIDYRDAAGELIVTKTLNYAAGPTQPAVNVKDYRTGINTQIGNQQQAGVVIDAGFDNFVRSQWDLFAAGDTVTFPFLVAGFDQPLLMQAKTDASQRCSVEQFCLEISLDSWLLGLLADPIYLVYARDQRRLLRYQGLSNIRGANDESLLVDIHYDYQQGLSSAQRALQPQR